MQHADNAQHISTPISHTPGFHPPNTKLVLISSAAENRRLSWLEVIDELMLAGHVTRLRQLYHPLSETLVATSLAAELFQRDALSLGELESIQKSRDTPSLAAQQLVNILMRSPRETYDCFLDALKRTDQVDAHMWLVLEGQYVSHSDKLPRQFLAAVRGPITVRTPPRGSDRVRNGLMPVFKKSHTEFYGSTKGHYDLGGLSMQGGG